MELGATRLLGERELGPEDHRRDRCSSVVGERRHFFDRYGEYVAAMASRYWGRIYGIEIRNEPWFEDSRSERLHDTKDWPSLVERYVELLKVNRHAVRATGSPVRLFGPVFTSPLAKSNTSPSKAKRSYSTHLPGTSIG